MSYRQSENPNNLVQGINFSLILLLWGLFAHQLSYEWAINAQYSYGLFVPFIALYLAHLRWLDRPAPESRLGTGKHFVIYSAVFVGILLQYPIKIIFEANADWRLVIWLQASIVFLLTALLLNHWGGRKWLIHFIFPFVFLLTAVPWPTFLEQEFVRTLMTSIATITVEVINFMGIHARRAGNIIYLSNGVVSVEEACSGIRSFQSTIMAGFLMGELVRFQLSMRMVLIAMAGMLAIFFNFCRTLLLTYLSATQGTELLEKWHDAAGFFVFIASFLVLSLLTFLLNKRFSNEAWKQTVQERTRSPFQPDRNPNYLPVAFSGSMATLLLCSVPAVSIWYTLRSEPQDYRYDWHVDWSRATHNPEHQEISSRIKDVLHYEKGEHVLWRSQSGQEWMAYFFEWDQGKAAQLGGVHNPEVCLPATGWTLVEKGEDFVWEHPDGLELTFNSYLFQNHAMQIYVFYCQWDKGGYPYHLKLGRYRSDRIQDAWIGDRKNGKQKLEIILNRADSLLDAQEDLIQFLNQAIVVQKTALN